MGRRKKRVDKPGDFTWYKDKIKILGIYFGNGDTSAFNWEPRINKIKATLDRWKARHLTLKGKAIIVNSLIGAGISYFGAAISCPEEYIKRMDDIICRFYWDDKPEKIKRDTIRSFKDMGGTGLLNIRAKLQAVKINILKRYTESSSKWRFLFDFWISKASGLNDLSWYVFNSPSVVIPETPTFYRDLI